MGYFFRYDKCEHKHRVYAFEVRNEKDELLGYRPVVDCFPKTGGTIIEISNLYPEIKWKVFSTEKLARYAAIDFFEKL